MYRLHQESYICTKHLYIYYNYGMSMQEMIPDELT